MFNITKLEKPKLVCSRHYQSLAFVVMFIPHDGKVCLARLLTAPGAVIFNVLLLWLILRLVVRVTWLQSIASFSRFVRETLLPAAFIFIASARFWMVISNLQFS